MDVPEKKWEIQKDEPHNTLALIALVSAIAAWIVIPVLGSIVGVICGHLAREQLREKPHEASSIMALLALILSYVQLVCVVLVVAFVMLFGWALLQGTF